METVDRTPMRYRAVSLASVANAGFEVLARGDRPQLGQCTLRGLPFDIPSDPGRCFLVLGRDYPTEAVIPLGGPALSLVFAHRLLESQILDGGKVGTPVVDLTFRFDEGSSETVTLRDRFEIASLPVRWGQLPFAAFADRFDRLPNRYEGRYEDAGVRQTEAGQGWARDYWLWAWINQTPGRNPVSIHAHALGPPFVIAGLCAGNTPEHPLRLPAARPVLIDIDRATLAATNPTHESAGGALDFDDHVVGLPTPVTFSLDIDRGVATFPYTVPAAPESAAQDDLVGFGTELNLSATPAYAYVAATPSATVQLRNGEKTIATFAWSDIARGDRLTTEAASIRLAESGRNWVRTSFVDADTGRPISCRVHFSSAAGVPYAPHGHHGNVGSDLPTWHRDVGGDVRLGQASYAYVDGACEGWLPRGTVFVDAACGFEYQPLRTRVTIDAQQRALRISLKRFSDLRREGWYSGDTHVHFLSTAGAHLEARGEGLSVINLLASQWGHLYTSTEEFTGQPSVSRDGETIVYASQENRQHVLGHLSLLGLKEPIVPWCTDGAEEAELGGPLEVTLSEWADRAHEQGATVIIPHLPNPNGEPAALIATGRADGVEFLEANAYNHLEYYRYLNGGYRLPLVGGTDKMSADVPVGLYRTYVRIPTDQEFTYATWCSNLAKGRTFVTSGPILTLSADGFEPGDTVQVKRESTVHVTAAATSIFPIHRLEVVLQGKVVAACDEPTGSSHMKLETDIRVQSDCWLAARVGGPDYFQFTKHRDLWQRGVMAHTSPIYITSGDVYSVFNSETAHYMLTLIDGSISYIRDQSPQHGSGQVLHHHGSDDHIGHLVAPLQHARSVVIDRIRQGC